MARTSKDDEVIAALEALAGALEKNAQDEKALARRIKRLSESRAKGKSWGDVLDSDPEPGTMVLVTELLARISHSSGSLRRALVTALREEGESIPSVARRFGVTHQRVSNLLRQSGLTRPRVARRDAVAKPAKVAGAKKAAKTAKTAKAPAAKKVRATSSAAKAKATKSTPSKKSS